MIEHSNVSKIMLGNNTPAWHKDGDIHKIVAGAPTIDEALRLLEMDTYQYSKRPLFFKDDNGNDVAVENAYTVARKDNEGFTGFRPVGSDYAIHPEQDSLALIDALMVTGQIRLETLVELNGGARIMAMASLTDSGVEIRKGDKHFRFLAFQTSHDGSSASTYFPTDVRGVCANTFRLAYRTRDKGMAASMRHSGSFEDKLAAASKVLASMSEQFERSDNWQRKLLTVEATKKRVDAFCNELFPKGTCQTEQGRKRSETIRDNNILLLKASIREEIVLLPQFTSTGLTLNNGKPMPTMLEVFNGLTRFVDHGRSAVREDAFEYAVIGGGADMKDKGAALIETISGIGF